MKPVVFAGPSIYGLACESLGHVDLAPPAACGDILRAAHAGRKVIGLIDGVFETGPSVWHKEILLALKQGISVWGAASMGALRAAECDTFGMLGVGTIYRQYKSGRRSRDSDVAVLHAPAELSFQPLTVAQVDVEDALMTLRARNRIDGASARVLEETSRSIFYKDRTWRVIFDRARLPETDTRSIAASLGAIGPGLKARDAIVLLGAIGRKHRHRRTLSEAAETVFLAELRRHIRQPSSRLA